MEEFVKRARSQPPVFLNQIPYLLAAGEEGVYYVTLHDMLFAFKLDGEYYHLGFLDLKKRVLIEVDRCEGVEEATTLVDVAEDVPWSGQSTKYAFSVYPAECGGGRAFGFIALKINVELDKAYHNWGAVALYLLRDRTEQYLQVLNKKYKVLDAVEIE
ncbi:hypothetical protein [Pyrobaculum ferrireducens]|uniref:Glutathione-S-transferase-like protein n=1 Tax=Pyrobaculum ferrireducens TaxID=1104324 RepID=G7VH40_9CREN|nr:hypothetical protein [Pyrobaculum ferrireducens]AET33211.1 glutathione-S-transferase-like protein [Pyrobaculum ferrireducens]